MLRDTLRGGTYSMSNILPEGCYQVHGVHGCRRDFSHTVCKIAPFTDLD